MGYDGSGKYFNCAHPPLDGWQARNRNGFDWSEEFGTGAVPKVVPMYLEVTNAADTVFNGGYHMIGDGIWKNPETGTRIASGPFGAGKPWACQENAIVWWMRDTSADNAAKYFNCATGDLPPVSGWQARDQNRLEWSDEFVGRPTPVLTFVFR